MGTPQADALPHVPAAPAHAPGGWHALWTLVAVLPARIRKGRPLRLLARALVAAAASVAVALVQGTPGIVTALASDPRTDNDTMYGNAANTPVGVLKFQDLTWDHCGGRGRSGRLKTSSPP